VCIQTRMKRENIRKESDDGEEMRKNTWLQQRNPWTRMFKRQNYMQLHMRVVALFLLFLSQKEMYFYFFCNKETVFNI
jgi:hypothetical protein